MPKNYDVEHSVDPLGFEQLHVIYPARDDATSEFFYKGITWHAVYSLRELHYTVCYCKPDHPIFLTVPHLSI